jgi:outer membrane beta-barrel protein
MLIVKIEACNMMNCRIKKGLLGALVFVAIGSVFSQKASGQSANAETSTAADPVQEDFEIQGVEKELGKGGDTDIIAPVRTAPIKVSPTVDFKSVEKSKDSSDIIIIQKNYMPKTERFQVFGGLTLAPNDVFFRTFGFQLRAAYHFSEMWGVEVVGLSLNSTKTKETTDLEEKQSVETKAVVSPRSYLGVDAYFNSMYGKSAVLNRKIVPFEIYQSIGLGKMNTATSTGADAFHLGLGQIFSLSRGSALRVDLSLIVYQSKDVNNATQATNTILLTVGYGQFYPEATYR